MREACHLLTQSEADIQKPNLDDSKYLYRCIPAQSLMFTKGSLSPDWYYDDACNECCSATIRIRNIVYILSEKKSSPSHRADESPNLHTKLIVRDSFRSTCPQKKADTNKPNFETSIVRPDISRLNPTHAYQALTASRMTLLKYSQCTSERSLDIVGAHKCF